MAAEHQIVIPGLDRQFCGVCRRWVCRPNELERLQAIVQTAGKKQLELQRELDADRQLAKRCPGRINRE